MNKVIHTLFFSGLLISLSSYTILPIDRIAEKGINFNHLPGFHAKPIEIKATLPEGYNLDYSIDGSLPTYRSKSLTASIRLDTVTSLTLLLSRNGASTDTFYCGTYIVSFQSVLPISSITIPREDLFDPKQGIYVGGMTPDGTIFGNCWKDIEKRAFFEYFDKESKAISQGCGLKIFGGMTKQNKEKSLRVIARKIYGKGRFKHKLFNTKEIDDFNSIVLRISGNDLYGTRFLDMMNSSIAADLGIDYMAFQPSVLFVNGEYWGIHNLREKINEDYLEKNHGADVTKTDLLIGNGRPQHGSEKSYKELIEYLGKLDGINTDILDTVSNYMDIDNYLKYSILQIHIVNTDSRGNIRYWKSSNLDNRFRWIFYDSDLSFYDYNLDFLGKKLSPIETDWYNPEWSTFVLRKLMSYKSIREKFITEYCYQLSTLLSPGQLQERILRFKKKIEPEIARHTKRRGFNQSVRNWESHVNRLNLFAQKRYEKAYQDIQSNFNLGKIFELTIDTATGSPHHYVMLNGNKIRSLPFKGKFFAGIGMQLETVTDDPEWVFKGWSDGNLNPTRTFIHQEGSDSSIHTVFSKRSASAYKGSYRIEVVGTGSWKGLCMVYIRKESNGANSSVSELISGSLHMSINESQSDFVICNDSNLLKKYFPYFNGRILQNPSLSSSAFHPLGKLIVTDDRGQVIDLFKVSVQGSKLPFFVREGDSTRGIVQIPVLGKQVVKKDSIARNQKLWLIVSLSLSLIGISSLLIWRKRRSTLLSLDA